MSKDTKKRERGENGRSTEKKKILVVRQRKQSREGEGRQRRGRGMLVTRRKKKWERQVKDAGYRLKVTERKGGKRKNESQG